MDEEGSVFRTLTFSTPASRLSSCRKMSILPSGTTTMASPWNSSMSEGSEFFQFTWKNSLFIFLASLMSITTVVANVILIILSSVDAKLRRNSNYYIVSLAFADLLVGIFVIPMFSLYTILGRWPLGSLVCEIWIIVDFTCVSASVFSICMISLNRYWAITQPVKYHQRQRKQRAMLFVSAIWIMAVLCWIPAVLAHRFVLGSFAVDSACLYLPGFVYVLLSNTIIYFIPMGAMIYLYVKMLYALKQNLLKLQRVHATEMKPPQCPHPIRARKSFCCCREKVVESTCTVSNIVDKTNLSISTISLRVDSTSTLDVTKMADQHGTDGGETCHPVTTANTLAPSLSHRFQKRHSINNVIKSSSQGLKTSRVDLRNMEKYRLHQRRARTLGIIVVAFLLCWISFVILFPINSYCNCIPLRLYDMSYWLAYLNSTLNPFLYGFNKDFRKALRRLICSSK